MNEQRLMQSDRAIEACRQDLTRDTVDLIAIDSVKGAPEPGAPFGLDTKKMLDSVLKMGERKAFISPITAWV